MKVVKNCDKKMVNDLSDYVLNHTEFLYLKRLSVLSQSNYLFLVNFALDDFNYLRRQGVSVYQSKFLSLVHSRDYVGCKN